MQPKRPECPEQPQHWHTVGRMACEQRSSSGRHTLTHVPTNKQKTAQIPTAFEHAIRTRFLAHRGVACESVCVPIRLSCAHLFDGDRRPTDRQTAPTDDGFPEKQQRAGPADALNRDKRRRHVTRINTHGRTQRATKRTLSHRERANNHAHTMTMLARSRTGGRAQRFGEAPRRL